MLRQLLPRRGRTRGDEGTEESPQGLTTPPGPPHPPTPHTARSSGHDTGGGKDGTRS